MFVAENGDATLLMYTSAEFDNQFKDHLFTQEFFTIITEYGDILDSLIDESRDHRFT